MPRLVEQIYPYLISFAWLGLWIFKGFSLPAAPEALLGASVTMGSIFVGFLATSKAIFATIYDSIVMKKLYDQDKVKFLVWYLGEATFISMLLIAISIIGFFQKVFPKIVSSIWSFFIICSALTFLRVVVIFLKILRNLGKKERFLTGG